MMFLWSNLLIKISYMINLFEWVKWLAKQYFEPYPIGTIFVKQHGKFSITYEVIGHTPDRFPKAVLDEISRTEMQNDKSR